ncbi:nucleoside ABC transporter membrane protein [Frankineae bacterium MT45]|nr:nucleoside ABC transporter membrane protein [Frankineae bacterium MT45]
MTMTSQNPGGTDGPGQSEGELIVHHTVVEPPVSLRRRLISGGSLVVLGVICALGWGVGADSGRAVFSLSPVGAEFQIPNIQVPGEIVAFLLGIVIVGLGVWQMARGFTRRQMKYVLAISLVLFVTAFLCWAATGTGGRPLSLVGLLKSTITEAVPLILGALAGILCERSGVINVAIEGQLLAGAFAGALGASVAGSLGVGLVAAMLAGALISWLLAVFAIRYRVNQVVLGVVLIALATGLTGFGYDAFMQTDPEHYNTPNVFQPLKIPLLGDIPIIGPALFDVNLLVYITYALIIAVDVALFRTRWGLRTRAVGEHPKAADTVGIKVLRTRYRNVVAAGMVSGLGGAFLTLGGVGAFSKGMSSGKGFIALAAVIFGRWSPRGAVGAALLFGFADALQSLLSAVGTPVTIPSDLLLMLPYLATLFAVAGLVGKVQAPAADGEPYVSG